MSEKKLNMRQELLSEMLKESLTRSDFEELATKLVEHIKKVKDTNVKELEAMKKALDNASSANNTQSEAKFGTLQAEINKIVSKHTNDSSDALKGKITELDERMKMIRDGKDSDDDSIIERVIEAIKVPTIEELKDELPVMGEEVRDALELLSDDDRLDVSAIKGIKKLIKKLTSKMTEDRLRFVGGTPRPIWVDNEDLKGTKNGVNKVFTLNNPPSPTNSLKLYKDGQRLRLTTDFTISGNTITLVYAIESDQLLYADYSM